MLHSIFRQDTDENACKVCQRAFIAIQHQTIYGIFEPWPAFEVQPCNL